MNILTINAEDWYTGIINPSDKDWARFEYRVEKMLWPILDEVDKRGLRAIVFCMGWMGEHHPEMIKEVVRRGHRIGCNGYWHDEPRTMTRDNFVQDAKKAKYILEETSGQRVSAYRAPNFAIDGICDWYYEALAECGFTQDFSAFAQNIYEIKTPKGSVQEWPVSKYKQILPFSGGGYFRLLPYTLIKHCMNKSSYVMTYFHPRDFDIDQPHWDGLSIKDKFLNYIGVRNAFKKLVKMLNDFEFDAI